MSTIGRISASALAATNENTFGLANFNIDFSLVKVEAPIEYQGLRSALSRHRVENAEQGPQHRTARRLGALFEQILPPIKTLAEAYGRRASQIADAGKNNSPGSPRHGPFAQYTGLDGTSIYAAATSGSGAIAVHLLACLLARTWSGPEAIAIWVELVAERKKDIVENTDASQIQGLAARVAAQQDISRVDLATWDASARAWLLSADEIQKFNLTQLRLIIKDSGLLVSSFGTTYKSVIDVWTTAMKTLQDLILGRPQRISKGALLVGLSCWHIFPDLNVVGPLTHVKFNNKLVEKGGIITLGLQSASPNSDPGVQWSLSLSHLRYYGKPVTVSSRTGANGSRISMEDLQMVALGAIFGAWGQCVTDPYAGAGLIVALRSCLARSTDAENELRFPIMHLLWSTSRRLLTTSCETDRASMLCLIAYGRRRAQNFLFRPSDTLIPAFGTADINTLWKLVTMKKPEQIVTRIQEIDNLRKFAEICGLGADYGIIRYPRTDKSSQSTRHAETYAYTTAIPYLKRPQKRDLAGTPKNDRIHGHWVAKSQEHDFTLLETVKVSCQHGQKMQSGPMWQDHELPPDKDTYISDVSFNWINPQEPFDDLHGHGKFHRCFGYQHGAALFRATDRAEPGPLYDWQIKKILEIWTPDLTRVQGFCDAFTKRGHGSWHISPESKALVTDSPAEILHKSLNRLVLAANLYRQLPGATISISIVDRPLNDAHCFTGLSTTLAAKFACIAMFETGSCSVQAEQLRSVMALSSGNNIYVANALLQDPSKPYVTGYQGITRIVGNIDHPGVVMLAPPQSPLIRSENTNSCRVVNHDIFNGKLENYFPETSLHLSFTKYEVPLIVPVGAVDAEISMVETLISAHDQKSWVADLDIVSSLKCEKYFYRLQSPHCSHENDDRRAPTENAAVQIGKVCGKQLVSIASWEELLDPPNGMGRSTIAVVRAYDNWHARVAAMPVCVQLGLSTGVLPTKPLCTVCGNQVFVNMGNWAQVLIF
ncbi:MAG: hypothetical protein Q9169_002008 [Polycauliona sp. 2 TL-2023]